MSTVSIGTHRKNGEFAILATLNNKNDLIGADLFQHLISTLCETLTGETGELVEAIEREDVPDCVNLAEDTW